MNPNPASPLNVVRSVPIAFCITDLEIGGAERMLTELAVRLDRRRFDPQVLVLGSRPQGDDEALALKLEAAGVPVAFFQGRSWPQAPRVVRDLAQALRRQQPRIVQTFLWHANLLGAMAARMAGAPRIVAGIRVAGRETMSRRWLGRLGQSKVDRFVCVSRQVADSIIAERQARAERIVVIPNGIDADAYPAEPAELETFGVAPGRRTLVYIGRLEPQKRVDWLLERMPAAFAQLPEHDLLIVGKGFQRPRLERQADRLGVAHRVHFTGWRPDAARILSAADLLLLTSEYEGMPNVVLEAMASGKPVVATRAEGVMELLGEGEEAQHVAIGDAAAFARQAAAIAGSPQLARALGEANRRRVAEHFTVQHMVARYEQLYESLVT